MKKIYLLLMAFALMSTNVFSQEKSRILEDGGNGPFKAVMTERNSLPRHTIFMPQDLSTFGPQKTLPVLVWGNGACTDSPWEHKNFLNEIASYGYLILATGVIPMDDNPYQGPMSTTQQQIESIDWAFAQNADAKSELYGKIDTSNICVAGMSCGGLQTLFNCHDPRIKTLMICNSGLFKVENAARAVGGMPMPQKDKLKEIHTPVLYILGGKEDIAYENGMDDFYLISHVPAYMANFPVGHGGTYRQPHGGEFTIVALKWLDWQLKGDKEAEAFFSGTNPTLSNRKDWTLERNAIAVQTPPTLEFVMQLKVNLGEAYSPGQTPTGKSNVIPITGGTFEGPNIRGTIISGGADWQHANGPRSSLEAIYSIKTDDGVVINVRNEGIICSEDDGQGHRSFYFKAAPKFEAPIDSKYNWLNNALFLCQPEFSQKGGITLNVWMVK